MGGVQKVQIGITVDMGGEYSELPTIAQAAFDKFVNLLNDTENPYLPEIQTECWRVDEGKFAYPLGDGWYLIWKVKSTLLRHSIFHFHHEVYLLGFVYKE